MVISHTQQDYIKTIWRIAENEKSAKMKIIADEIGVKPSTVFAMIRQLEHLELITYTKKTGACLTEIGKMEAERIIRNHRLIETFLQKVLDVREPFLHDEAEKLEHVISDNLIRKIDAYLGYPRKDPHGSHIPVPNRDKKICTLDKTGTDVRFRIVQIPDSVKEKTFCQENGFIPGSQWTIKQVGPDYESYLVTNDDIYLALSGLLARGTIVEISSAFNKIKQHGERYELQSS